MNRRIIIPEGAVAPHEHDIDKSLHDAIAVAMGERKVRFTDRRLIVMYIFIVAAAILGFLILKGQQDQRDHDFDTLQRALQINCRQQQFIVDKANAYYLAQINAVEQRTDLKPADKTTLLLNYREALFPSLRCDLLPKG